MCQDTCEINYVQYQLLCTAYIAQLVTVLKQQAEQALSGPPRPSAIFKRCREKSSGTVTDVCGIIRPTAAFFF
jgi:hypothetical protein